MGGIDGEHAAVFGRVMNRDGMPVADVAVTIVGGPTAAPDLAAITDAEGWFAFGGLPDGRWAIRAYAPDGRVGEAEASIGSHGMCVIFLGEPTGDGIDRQDPFDGLDDIGPAPSSRPGSRPQRGWELSTPESD